jgi:hypothetical protein
LSGFDPSATLATNTSATILRTLVDTDLDGSGISLYARNSLSSWDIYDWDNDNEQFLLRYSGVGSTTDSIPFMKNLNGSHFYDINQSHAEIIETQEDVKGVKVFFRLWGENNARQSANFSLYYATNFGSRAINNRATLTNPSHGGISGNSVQFITADNGATLYSVIWDLQADGVSPGSFYKLIGQIVINRPQRRRKKRKAWYKKIF